MLLVVQVITLAHIAITQADIDAGGSTRVLDEAIERLRAAYLKEHDAHPIVPARVFRFDLSVEEEA